MLTRRSERSGGDRAESSLDAAMRAPSTTTPDVVVIDFVEEDVKKPVDMADPKKDLWLSTVDGRYSSAIIPIRVGLDGETFRVHRDILTKSEYFRKALDGQFREAGQQAIDLPEEDPDIFSFVVAWLYEEKFVPIKTVANVLVAQADKGKGKEDNEEVNTASDDGNDGSSASGSDDSVGSRRRRESRRRRQDRITWERQRRKEPGRHRPDCTCNTCTAEIAGPPCWACGAARSRPLHDRHRQYRDHPPPPRPPVVIGRNGYPHPPRPAARDRDRRRGVRNNQPIVLEDPVVEERMTPEDLRTWSLAYTLSIDVYICAERYLMQDFKACIAALIINSFEVAGLEAALPAVLQSCKALNYGISSTDPLLKKVFARVGFLYARMCKNFPDETQAFFSENPELALSIMKEMVERREDDLPSNLPPMDRPAPHLQYSPEDVMIQRRRYEGPIYR